MKTYSAKPSDVTRKWYVVDASELPLGRLSTRVADFLIGKSKPSYTPHIDGGDYVIVINSDQLVVTGKKLDDKKYYRHSGYPGGLKESNLAFEMEKDSTEVIRKAVRGMLPVNKLRDGRLARLKIYKDGEHNHTAQKPETLNLSKKEGK
jgi:large subunit ribosomal protein L13